MRRLSVWALIIGACVAVFRPPIQTATPQNSSVPSGAAPRAVFEKYCFTCHNQRLKTAGLVLDTLDTANPSANAEVWERVIEKLRAGSMPPPGNIRPDPETYRTTAIWLENEIDRA